MSHRISIVLPTYNQGHFLGSALDSIFNQTLLDFELIVVDDGSTDDTARLLAHHSQHHTLQVITQENQGLPCALNAGFAHASGDFWTWTSSDNILLPTMLATLARELAARPKVGVVYADWYFINEQGQCLGLFRTLDYDRDILLRFNFVHCCFLFRSACFEQVGGYDPRFIYSEDWEFWIRVSRQFRMWHVSQPLYLYRVHPESMTTDILEQRAQGMLPYAHFASHLRSQYPVSWYYGILKWKIRSLLRQQDPLRAWQRMISLSRLPASSDSRIAQKP